jgi:hypothetical protein
MLLSDPKAGLAGAIPIDTVWSILEAANDLGDTDTVDACRRAIDADLRGGTVSETDLDVIAAFFA